MANKKKFIPTPIQIKFLEWMLVPNNVNFRPTSWYSELCKSVLLYRCYDASDKQGLNELHEVYSKEFIRQYEKVSTK
jgi:hypothetical protein